MEKPKRWKNSPLAGLGVRYIGLGRAHRAFSQTTVARLLLRVALVLPAVASALFLVRHTQTDTSSQKSGTRHSNRHGISWCNAYSLDGQQERETNAISFSPRTVWGPGARRFGIVFFPGASVNRTSCATVAGKPSDRGILVVVLSLQEPTRFDNHKEANKQRALAAIQDVVSETGARVDERVLSGHSAGAGTAVTLVSEMNPRPEPWFCVASTRNTQRMPPQEGCSPCAPGEWIRRRYPLRTKEREATRKFASFDSWYQQQQRGQGQKRVRHDSGVATTRGLPPTARNGWTDFRLLHARNNKNCS